MAKHESFLQRHFYDALMEGTIVGITAGIVTASPVFGLATSALTVAASCGYHAHKNSKLRQRLEDITPK